MFYSQFILAKKGPLGTIWIAAHLERKLRKNQVADTDIGVSVDSILSPDVPIALRLSSHLLLGVVRIYSKKVNYLFDDCSEALLKVKQAFRSAAVDLPPEQSKAPYHSITLPETFDLDDFELPDNEMFQGNFVDHHVSSREQITLQDTMDGVSFPTSQFGPDERFGDGDASQIGLDLDEELFMDKGDGAGTSGILVGTDIDPQVSTQELPNSKGDELDEEVSNPPPASNTNYFSIRAPSTPGLTEEPNWASAKEEVQVSDEHVDDHMDEDQNASEVVVKEVSGTASRPMEPSGLVAAGFHSSGNTHYMEDNELVRTFETGSIDFGSSGVAEPATLNEHLEATNDQNNMGVILENEGTIAADVQSKGCFDADEVVAPVAENANVVNPRGCDPYPGYNKVDVNGTYHPLHDTGAENIFSVGPAIQGTTAPVKSVSEPQNSFQPCVYLQNAETVSNSDEKSSGFVTPVLQACTSKPSSTCDGVDNVCDSSNLPVQVAGSSFGMAGREGRINFLGVSSNVGDELEPTSKDGQITHGVTFAAGSQLEGSLDNLITEENHFEKEINLELSNFPPPELLLSMPNLPAGPSHNFVVDYTPGREVFSKDCNASDENILSGRKRSFTESTLTIQSVNSVESSGGAQSKGTVEYVPDDNDLLSSILVGRTATGLQLKPTPVPDKVRAKRQRTAVRSAVNKRKVLIEDSTVLHGDTIRQQLTHTEDIRRVRKKAPCTHLDVWVLRKQFLEDEIFSESVFTGMFPALQSLDSGTFDLNGIRILQDDGNKEASEVGISTRPTVIDETEAVGPSVPSTADISTGTTVNEESDDVRTLTSSVAEAEGLHMSGGDFLESLREQEPSLALDGSTHAEETQKADNDIMKEMLDSCSEKANLEFDNMRSSVGGEAMHSVPSGAVPESCEVNCNSMNHANVDSTPVDKSGDVAMLMHIDESGQLLDQRSPTHCASGDVSMMEDVSVSGTQDQGLDAGVSEKVDLDERSAGEHILELSEGFDTNLVTGHVYDSCSLPDHDSGACATTNQVEDYQVDGVAISIKDENQDLGLRHDGSQLTSSLISDHVTLDTVSAETDLGSQKTTLIEMEGPLYWENDPKIVMDSTPILSGFINTENNAEFGMVFEHDTDFLNVDDNDVGEDYESDMPDPEEKRILDNSGWSSRTRAVANYLQVLFEKEYDDTKRVVSLDNLLAGKTRKEASRMFFETLVLKTKDYIQAKQENSFYDIKIQPRGKLLKSEFGSHT